MADEIIIHSYDPDWPTRYEAERARLVADFAGRVIALEHGGSTAIPGLDSKPVIDIAMGLDSMGTADALLEPLVAVGWDTSPAFNATMPDRRFLRRCGPDGERTHHLHLVVYEGEQWHRLVDFRDRLCADPNLVRQYQALKYQLAEQYRDDREAYTDAKTEFIDRVIGKR
jgi:GrpB-like predicted nucleotidyltransferase (UPF0157 family)